MVRGESSTSDSSPPPVPQNVLTPLQSDLLERLASLDPDRMTPREALDALYALKAEESGAEKMPEWVEE
jgi:hypothetical protein